jgi:hypothetical protein
LLGMELSMMARLNSAQAWFSPKLAKRKDSFRLCLVRSFLFLEPQECPRGLDAALSPQRSSGF